MSITHIGPYFRILAILCIMIKGRLADRGNLSNHKDHIFKPNAKLIFLADFVEAICLAPAWIKVNMSGSKLLILTPEL